MLITSPQFAVWSDKIVAASKEDDHYDRHTTYILHIQLETRCSMRLEYAVAYERDIAFDAVVDALSGKATQG